MGIQKRKEDHLELCLQAQVESRNKTTLFEDIEFIPNSIPQVNLDEVDPGTFFLSKRLKAPILIGAMVGGTKRAQAINKALASAAAKYGLGFGVGSQRAMHELPSLALTYQIRDVAPDILFLANLGIQQARNISSEEIQALVDSIEADAISIHLNTAMELIQPEGDTDFSKSYETLERLNQSLKCPLIVKETGGGLSREVGLKLKAIGIDLVDIGGAGGTSWVGIESLRSQGVAKQLGELFWDWGIPTAASLCELKNLGFTTIASGGIRNGLEIAKAIALGATVAGIALPFLKKYASGGLSAVEAYIDYLVKGLRMAMLLTGCRNLTELQQQKLVITGKLKDWLISRHLPLP